MDQLAKKIQEELLKPDCDIVSALRQAHVLALKNGDNTFDKWILLELNGYPSNCESIPEYREIRGKLKALNPFGGSIPVLLTDPQVEKAICEKAIGSPIPELLEFVSDKTKQVHLSFSGEIQKALNDTLSKGMNFEYVLFVQTGSLINIIECVKTKLVEWVIKTFPDSMDENLLVLSGDQNVIINGGNNILQIQNGQGNTISNTFSIDDGFINSLLEELDKDSIGKEDKEEALSMISDLRSKIKNNKKQSVLKSILLGIKDFLINVGAGLAVAYIESKLKIIG